MAQKISPFIEVKYGWNLGESGWNSGMDENLVKFSYLFSSNIDGVVDQLPSPVEGNAYFNTVDKRVYFTVGGVYYSTVIPKWFYLKDKATGKTFQYNGSTLQEITSIEDIEDDLAQINTQLASLGTASQQDSDAFVFSQDLADVLNFNNGAALVGRGVQVVNSISELREVPKDSPSKVVYVTSYYEDLKGGGGFYKLNANDTTSLDNGGTVIVNPSDNGRWNLIHNGEIDIRQFGARSDDENRSGTNSHSAIQAAISWASLNKVNSVKVVGNFMVNDTLVIDTGVFTQGINLIGDGTNSRIRQTGLNKDVIWFSTSQFLRNSSIRNISLESGATSGHCVNIKYGCTLCKFDNINATALNPSKSLFYGVWSSLTVDDPQGIFDSVWSGGDYYLTTSHTVPGFVFATRGTAFNENIFENMRCHQAFGGKFFSIQNVDNQTYLVNNRFENINFENCPKGGILCTNSRGWTLSNISFWDTTLYTDHLIHFAQNSGLRSTSNTLINIQRNGDVLSSGVKDIWTEYADSTLIINCYNTPDLSPAYDWSNNSVTIIGQTLSGESNASKRVYINNTTSPSIGMVVNASGGTVQFGSGATYSKISVGTHRFTFLQPKTNTGYRISAMASSGTACYVQANKTTTYFDLVVVNSEGSPFDPSTLDVTCHG